MTKLNTTKRRSDIEEANSFESSKKKKHERGHQNEETIEKTESTQDIQLRDRLISGKPIHFESFFC